MPKLPNPVPPKLPMPKIPTNFHPKPPPPIPPRIVMKPTVDLTPPIKRGPGRPPKPKDPDAPEVVKRGPGRPRKAPPVVKFDPRKASSFEAVFPVEEGPSQIKFAEGEGWKLLSDDEHYITVVLDRGSFVHLWGLLRIETKRKWGSTLSDIGAYKRALKAFSQAYKEANGPS